MVELAQLLGRAVAAEALVCGVVFCGYVVAARLVGRPTLLRWLAAAVVAAWIASMEFHLLSSLHAFSLAGALTAVGSSALIALGVGSGERPVRWWWRRDRRWLRWTSRRFARSSDRAVAAAFTLFGVITIAHSFLLPPLGWDSLTYHAVKAATWLQRGGIVELRAPGTWAFYENFWGGAEVLMAWSLLPFHADTLAMAMQSAHWIVLGLSVVALARELGAREPYPSSVAALVLATPTIRMQVGTGYVEIAELAFLVSGAALAARFLITKERGSIVTAAAALGLAAGVKSPALLPAMVALGMILMATLGRASSRSRSTRAATLVAAIFAFAAGVAPWLWHAWQTTGAPLSPVPVHVLGMDLGRANEEVAAHLARPVPAWSLAEEIWRLFDTLLRGYENPGPASVIAALLGFAALPRLLRRREPAAVLVSLMIVTSIVEYYSTGLAVVRRYWPASSVRFLLVPLVLGITSSVGGARERRGVARPYLWFLWAGTFLEFGLYLYRGISPRAAVGIFVLLLAGAMLCSTVASLSRRSSSAPLRFVVLVAGLAVFLVVVREAHDRMRPELERVGFVSSPVRPYCLDAAAAVDDPGEPRRIAVTSGPWRTADNWIVYPFFGRELQNEVLYVPVSADGVVRHFGSPAVDAEYARMADFDSWRARLRSDRVTAVMSFSPVSVELVWMEAHPDVFRRLVGDAGDWGLFAVSEATESVR